MAAIFQQETGYEDVGTTCTVPNNDIARVMYYLHCVTVGCDMDVLQDDLVDYKHYYRLSKSRADGVFLAAYTYSPDELIGKTLFRDGTNEFTENKSNAFLKVTEATSILAVQESVLVAGKQTKVAKVMVYTDEWLKTYYIDPMERNVDRIQRASSGASSGRSGFSGLARAFGQALAEVAAEAKAENRLRHCGHCKGQSGKCSCSFSCDRPSASTCYPDHCDHCNGHASTCACKSGCAPLPESKCVVVHEARCDMCLTAEIVGTRYRCAVCSDYDLCNNCYIASAKRHVHDTHPFVRSGPFS
jgi:Zinc finger, ZZ type